MEDKLITLENLDAFLDNVIVDSSVATKSTWSSQLINNELADKQDVLTAGAGIDISNGVISATGGGGSVDMMVEVTYAELKALRDNKQLVPGQQYRITDYVTTTAQANTQSTGHQFDIIVTADAEDKLNENARAINHIFDTSGLTTYYRWYDDFSEVNSILTEEAEYPFQSPAGTCPIECQVEGLDYYTTGYTIAGVINNDNPEDSKGAYVNYRKVILYTNNGYLVVGDYIDEEIWNRWEESKQEDNPSYTPQPYPEWFIGKYIIDEAESGGEKWRYVGTYTEGIDTHFDNSKLNAWELKYCLDNDTTRFDWAKEGNEGHNALMYNDGNSYICVRYSEGDNTGTNPSYPYAWARIVGSINKTYNEITDWSNMYTEGLCFTESETPSVEVWNNEDEVAYALTDYSPNAGAVPSGKGVIYYMKDEWNNQFYFDFKNIKLYSNQYNDYAFIFGSLDYNPLNADGTITGASNNNIVERQISNGVLSIDTSTFLFDEVGYQNIVEGASYTAGANIQINNGVISATDTKYTAGSHISISSGNVISSSYSDATTTASGLMSAVDKTKLNGLSNYTLPTAAANTKGGVKVGSGLKMTGEVLSADITKNYIYDLIHNLTVTNISSLNNEYFTILGLEEGDVHFCSNGLSIEYSTDKTNWTSITGTYDYDDDSHEIGTIVKHIMPAEKIYFRGNNNTYCIAGQYGDIASKIFVKNAAFDVLGNMMSLVDSTNFSQFTTMTSNNNKCFKGFFAGDNVHFKLRNTKDLILPATTLADSCYDMMFAGCTNLTAAPALPATTLASGCYNSMFRNCTSLTTAPELPATILVSNCYEEMFESCYRLNYIKCLATDISANRCTKYWTVEVFSETGTFVTPQSTNWTTGSDGIPEGWTRVDA